MYNHLFVLFVWLKGQSIQYSRMNNRVDNNQGIIKMFYLMYGFSEASRGAGAQSVTVKSTGCGFDPHSRR